MVRPSLVASGGRAVLSGRAAGGALHGRALLEVDSCHSDFVRAAAANLAVARGTFVGTANHRIGGLPRRRAGHRHARRRSYSRRRSGVLGRAERSQAVRHSWGALDWRCRVVACFSASLDLRHAKLWLYLDGAVLRGDSLARRGPARWIDRAYLPDPLAGRTRGSFLL